MTGPAPQETAAVVFGAQHPTGLLTARALRGSGLKLVGVHFCDSPCLRSNVWDSLVPAERSAADILETLRRLARESGRELLLLPADDVCVKILSDHRDELPPGCRITLPEAETVDLLLDKSLFYDWAERQGFAVPVTRRAADPGELECAIARVGYPLLIKPLYREAAWDAAFPSDKVFIVQNEAQRSALPPHLLQVASPVLVQQWIEGSDADIYFCLVQYSREGRLVNHLCGRKLMQWPPLGGSTAIAVSDDQNRTRDATVRLFDALRYSGLGSVEYKRDPRSGIFYIMEPTVGRNDFQSHIALCAGVNLTRDLCREMLGEGVAPRARTGKAVWFCEPSVWYAARHYLRRRDFYVVKHLGKLLRTPGFAYLSAGDTTPFVELVRSRLR